jgi:hypothetical protein
MEKKRMNQRGAFSLYGLIDYKKKKRKEMNKKQMLKP